MSRKYLEETQKFGSPGLYLGMGAIYVAVLSIFGFGFYRQLVLNDGKRILIGTRRPEAMLRAMNKMMELK